MLGYFALLAVMLALAIVASVWIAAEGGKESTAVQWLVLAPILIVLWGIVAFLAFSGAVGLGGD